jgi:hypothetical protein
MMPKALELTQCSPTGNKWARKRLVRLAKAAVALSSGCFRLQPCPAPPMPPPTHPRRHPTWHVILRNVCLFQQHRPGGGDVWLGWNGDKHVVATQIDGREHLLGHAGGVVQPCKRGKGGMGQGG